MKLKWTARLFAVYGAAAVVAGIAVTGIRRTMKTESYCVNEPNAIVSDACVSYSDIEQLNRGLRPLIQRITQKTDYFGYYRLNLYGKECPFWSDDAGTCGNRACAVETTDEDDIPELWRSSELGKLVGPKATQPKSSVEAEEPSPLGGALGPDTAESCVFESDDLDERDYCLREDEWSASESVYVSLVDNPERFTGYAGRSAHNVWDAVYQENCFLKKQPEIDGPSGSLSPFGSGAGVQQVFPNFYAANDLKNIVLERKKHELDVERRKVPVTFDDECVEKRIFHRILSGMHASISTHLCWDYLDRETGHWGPNLTCYQERLESHPDRLQNIYFNYALVIRAISKLRNHIPSYTFCSGDVKENAVTKSLVQELSDRAAAGHPLIFDESIMWKDPDAMLLKEDFRNRFRNVSRLMDCVGCDKCRLWGKVQTSGLGTALKVLFEFEENPEESLTGEPDVLRREEMVALVNTLDRISHSLQSADRFARMAEKQRAASGRTQKPPVATAPKEKPCPKGDLECEFRRRQRNRKTPQTASEQFWHELEQLTDAVTFVLRSWWEMPGKLYDLGVYQISVVYDKFTGRDRYVQYVKVEL